MTNEEAIKKLEWALNNNTIYDENEALEYILAVKKGIEALEQEPKWIPVSERLPEKTGLHLVSIGDLVTTANFDGHNFRTQAMVRFIPDAWMPLPEPYKAESEDKE